MKKSREAEVLQLIDTAETIGLVTHIDGDGDAFGSMLGLKRVLETIGKKVIVFSSEPLLSMFDFLAEEINYLPQKSYQPVDLLIGLDGNFFERFSIPELFPDAIASGPKTLIIDHHELSEVGDKITMYWGDPNISSASEMVYRLTKELNLKLDKVTATIILTGIETDTNSLQFENSKSEAFLAIADLLTQGARLKSVMDNAFSGRPLPVISLLGIVLERVRLTKDNLVVSYVTLADKKELGLTDKVSSGIANFIEQAEEGKVAIVFEEIEGGLVKASMRSNNSSANVARFSNYFGGGGHKKAAAFKFKGNLSSLIKS
jgi:bifunctional oligoribonuclease and PAP phosphatase NrnA